MPKAAPAAAVPAATADLDAEGNRVEGRGDPSSSTLGEWTHQDRSAPRNTCQRGAGSTARLVINDLGL
jgi:hypothetical protein